MSECNCHLHTKKTSCEKCEPKCIDCGGKGNRCTSGRCMSCEIKFKQAEESGGVPFYQPHIRLCQEIEDLIAAYRVAYPKVLEWDYGSTRREDNGRVVILSIEVGAASVATSGWVQEPTQ